MSKPDLHSAKRFIRPITCGIGLGAAACVLLLVIMSVVMSIQDIPQAAISLMSTLAFVAGGFVAGFACSALSRERGLLLGLCCGVLLFLILSLASLAVDGSAFGALAATKLAAVLFAAALGGVLGVNRRKKFR